jgi:hypothetical protein
MIYYATYLDERGRVAERETLMAIGDRDAVAMVLDSDPIFDENVAGWMLRDESGREIKPIDSDYR